MFTLVLTINATHFQRVYVCNASKQIHLPTIIITLLLLAVYRPPLLQSHFLITTPASCFTHLNITCATASSLCALRHDCMGGVFKDVVAIGGSVLYGRVCMDIIPVSFVLVSF